MKKSLIALAVLSAIAAPAFADTANVTIYGKASVSVDYVKDGDVTDELAATKLSSNATHLGFKGAEDMGDGVKAIWQYESAILVDGGASSLATRSSFVGLSSDMGTATIGRQETPYKMATRGLDMFADTLGDNRSLMGTGQDIRAANAIAYVSPKIADSVTLAIAYVAGAEQATAAPGTKGAATSAAAMYAQGPFSASIAYQTIKYGTAGSGDLGTTSNPVAVGDSTNGTKVGVGYTTDMFALNLAIEKLSNTTDFGTAAKQDRTNTYLAGKFNISANNAIKLAYTMAGKAYDVADSEASQYSIGFDHAMSKRTSLFAVYTKLTNKANANYALNPSSEVTGGIPSAGAESAPSAISLGMKTVF